MRQTLVRQTFAAELPVPSDSRTIFRPMPAPGMMPRDVDPPFIQNERSRQASFLADINASDHGEIRSVRLQVGADEAVPFSGQSSIGTPCQRKHHMGPLASRRAGVLHRELNAEMCGSGQLAEQGSGDAIGDPRRLSRAAETIRGPAVPLKAPSLSGATAQSKEMRNRPRSAMVSRLLEGEEKLATTRWTEQLPKLAVAKTWSRRGIQRRDRGRRQTD